jgi:hypothetical protein
VARTQDVWGAEGISGRVKFLLLAWAGMPKTSFRIALHGWQRMKTKIYAVLLTLLFVISSPSAVSSELYRVNLHDANLLKILET